ncbi:hypothetical protein BV22DRAFT_214946 [Leucogyrophana mollusca]|uniref:Uncharacterized protein n=1 Tax=Leucogyrophana mollusca TaxID=85980 RepID=A0ACB8BR02_9AGAM|nr:hypothetical protein BV22DRAFT_214946 [Leucogyrophana mollusca]
MRSLPAMTSKYFPPRTPPTLVQQTPPSRVPVELIPLILEHIVPHFPPPPPTVGCANIARWKLYKKNRSAFAQLATVSQSWYPFAQEQLLRTLVVVWLDESIRGIHALLSRLGSSVRVLVVWNPLDTTYRNCTAEIGTVVPAREFSDIANGCFALTTRLMRMECYGANEMFWSGYGNPLPALRPPIVRSLKMQLEGGRASVNETRLSAALSLLAPSLHELELENWMWWSRRTSKFRLQAAPLSRLHTLRLINCAATGEEVIALLQGSRGTLRKLEILNPAKLNEEGVASVLKSGGLGQRLDYLTVLGTEPKMYLKYCSSLTTFVCLSCSKPDIFASLPDTLQRLAITVYISPWTTFSPFSRPEPFISYISSPCARYLKHVAILIRGKARCGVSPVEVEEEAVLCAMKLAARKAGVSLTWVDSGLAGPEEWGDVVDLLGTADAQDGMMGLEASVAEKALLKGAFEPKQV